MSRDRRTGERAVYAGKNSPATPSACLDCGRLIVMALGVGHRNKPKPGSITICIECGHVMAFDGRLSVRPLTDAEVIALAGDPVIIAAQWARRQYQKEKRAT